MKNRILEIFSSIASRLTLLIAVAVTGVAVLTILFLYSEKSLILTERQNMVQQAVNTAVGTVEYFRSQAATGKLSEEQAKHQALESLRNLRYGENDYFWVNDGQPKMIMHPIKPALENTDLRATVDTDGKQMFLEMVATVKRSGSGFVLYNWPKAGSDSPVPKISFVKGIPEWEWIIGSGVYVDTVNETMRLRAIEFGIGGLIISTLLFFLGRLIANSITQPLREAVFISEQVAKGNLGVKIPTTSTGEVGQLMKALADMSTSLTEIVGKVRAGTHSITAASAQIADGNSNLSTRTEQQASSLEETAASLEQLTTQVQQNAESATNAQTMVQSASEVASRGGKTVAEVVTSMTAIHHSSSRIVEIIGVIDSIAFQTNILALNAAVEAARAGDQGRGFAVVAGEVRNLAQRASAASKEIASLIKESVSQVECGVERVEEAGRTIVEIVNEIQGVMQMMQQITHSTHEQTAGLLQINRAVSEMDQVTQHNATLVEEAASGAIALHQQAEQLKVAVSLFSIGPSAARQGREALNGPVLKA